MENNNPYIVKDYLERKNTSFDVGDTVKIGPAYLDENTYESDAITGLVGKITDIDPYGFYCNHEYIFDDKCTLYASRLILIRSANT